MPSRRARVTASDGRNPLRRRRTPSRAWCYAAPTPMQPLALPDAASRETLLTRYAAAPLIELGLNHEQQHQELLLTDILHAFSLNALRPAVLSTTAPAAHAVSPLRFMAFDGGLREIGHRGADFAFDNETPRHRVWLQPYALADRLVSCGEYREFIDDGGYRRPELWLSDGWALVQAEGWRAPLYWRLEDGTHFTLHGTQAL